MIQEISSHKAFEGKVSYWRHLSDVCKTEMKFSIYEPPDIKSKKLPVLFYLPGLTCTEETFMIKAGALRKASELGLILVSPDTSPRNTLNGEESKDWDFGTGAGFYLDAKMPPWNENYNMFSYVTRELPTIIHNNFNSNSERQSIFGHSMGGHGALICALKRPDLYKSVSAFAPISSPTNSPWGKKAFLGYLGNNQNDWEDWDSSYLIKKCNNSFDQILIDLKDRCGKPDGEILNLIENSKLRIIAANVGVKKIYTNHQNAMFAFNDNLTDQVYKKLIGLIQSGSAKIKLINESKITLDVTENTDKRTAVAKLLNELL